VTREAFETRLAALCLRRGAPGLPQSAADRAVLFKSVLLGMKGDGPRSEREMNAVLLAWLAEVAPAIESDHVSLRRAMVDEGWLVRDALGREYRAGDGRGAAAGFEASIDEVDPREVVRRAAEEAARRKRARGGNP
jgi:hypothetical protein